MATEKTFLFSQGNLMFSSFSYFYDMKKNKEMSDITIRIGNWTVSAHRIILAAAIPFFRTMFASELEEGKPEEVTMENLDPGALESLTDFAYTGNVEITTENVQSLLMASEFLQLTQVRDSCCDFLSKKFEPKNVMYFRTLAINWNCSSLTEKCERYIYQHFDEFSRTKEFLNVPFWFIHQLIRRDDLQVKNEERVFEAVMCWAKTDVKRHSRLPELLTGIRMTNLTPRFLIKKASREQLIMESFPCRNLLDEAKHYHFLPEERPTSCSFRLSQRNYEQQQQSGMYLFCYSEYSGLSVLKYVCETGKLNTLVTEETGNKFDDVIVFGHQIYVFEDNSFRKFSPVTCTWTSPVEFPDIPAASGHAVIYGKSSYWLDNRYRKNGMCFEPEQNKWHHHQQNISFRDAEVVSSSTGIYILNGLFEENGIWKRKSKVYNPVTKKTTDVKGMPTDRTGFACAAHDGKIYACGGRRNWKGNSGYTSISFSKCTEVYNPFDGRWRRVSDMSTPREDFSLVPYNNKLYAFGGWTQGLPGTERLIECYDPVTDKWTPAGSLDGQYDFVKAVVTSVQ